jgi:hypothetical protein
MSIFIKISSKENKMFNKIVFTFISIALLVVLAACNSFSVSGLIVPYSSSTQDDFTNTSGLTIQSKLGIGILKLEGTSLEVTADQAKTLLPLWKALRSLSTNDSIPAVEISALYKQIQESMTSDQLQVIQRLTWTEEDLNAMMQQFGIQADPSAYSGNLTSSQSIQAQSQNVGVQTAAGSPAGGGIPGPEFFGGIGIGGSGSSGQVQQNSKSTQLSASNAEGLNLLFANSVIELLRQHVNA